MQADAQAVQVVAHLQLVFQTAEALPLADLEILLLRDVVALVPLQRLADSLPRGGKRRADVLELLQFTADGAHGVREAVVIGEIDPVALAQARVPRPEGSEVNLAVT